MSDHDENEAIARIGIIGAGQMGGGIAQVCAVAGYEVYLQDVTTERVRQALEGITARLNRLVEKQKLTPAASAEALKESEQAPGLSCSLAMTS